MGQSLVVLWVSTCKDVMQGDMHYIAWRQLRLYLYIRKLCECKANTHCSRVVTHVDPVQDSAWQMADCATRSHFGVQKCLCIVLAGYGGGKEKEVS